MAALRVTRRWLLASRAASVHFCRVVAHRSFVPRSSSRSSAAYLVGVAALTHATQGTECLSRLATEVSEVQTELYAAVLSFMLR